MNSKIINNSSILIYFQLAAALILILLLYLNTLPKLLTFWERPDYSYAYIIPLILIWIFWTERKRLAAAADHGYKLAAIFLFLTGLFFILGSFSAILSLVFLSMWTLLLALLGIFYGDRGLKVLWPLAVTAIFAVPWPAFIFHTASFQLRLLSSYLAELMLRAISIPVFREGNIIDLGSIQLEVVDACSGLRYLLPSILISVLAGWLFLKRPRARLVLVLMSIPVAVFSNSFRIMITGILCRWFGPKMAEGFFHDFSGWLVYVISLVVLLGLLYILRKWENKRPEKFPVPQPEKIFHFTEHLPGKKQLSLLLLFLALLLGASLWASRPAPVLEHLNLADFPQSLGDWQASPISLDPLTLESLGTEQIFNAGYTNLKTGASLFLLITYYPEQDSRAAAHAPTSCMLGGGWSILRKNEIKPAENIHQMPMTAMLLKKQEVYILGNFWFQQRGHVVSNEFLNKLYLFADAFKIRRTDGGLVRIELPLSPGMTPKQGQKIVDGFIELIKPEIPKYIPS